MPSKDIKKNNSNKMKQSKINEQIDVTQDRIHKEAQKITV